MRTDATSIGGLENLPCAAGAQGGPRCMVVRLIKRKPGFGIEPDFVAFGAEAAFRKVTVPPGHET
jgi:hypothetical protein